MIRALATGCSVIAVESDPEQFAVLPTRLAQSLDKMFLSDKQMQWDCYETQTPVPKDAMDALMNKSKKSGGGKADSKSKGSKDEAVSGFGGESGEDVVPKPPPACVACENEIPDKVVKCARPECARHIYAPVDADAPSGGYNSCGSPHLSTKSKWVCDDAQCANY